MFVSRGGASGSLVHVLALRHAFVVVALAAGARAGLLDAAGTAVPGPEAQR